MSIFHFNPVRKARESIAYVYALAFYLLALSGIILLSLLVVQSYRELAYEQLNQFGDLLVKQYAQSITEPLFTDDTFAIEILSNRLLKEERIRGVGIFSVKNRDNLLLLGEVPEDFYQRIKATSSGHIAWGQNREKISYFSAVEFDGAVAGYATITLSLHTIRENSDRALFSFVGIALLVLIATLVLAYYLSQKMAKPIESLVKASNMLGEGDYSVYLKTSRVDEIGRLTKAINSMARSLRKKQRIENLLNKFVDHHVAEKFISHIENTDKLTGDASDQFHKVAELGTREAEVTIVFVDIVGFTAFAETSSPKEVVELLNEYFSLFTLCAQKFHGYIDKFIGDCAMVVFDPGVDENFSHRLNAILCAASIQQLIAKVNEKRSASNLSAVKVSIGVNTGSVSTGVIGAESRMEYTVVGDAVNLASRLCEVSGADEILVGENTLDGEDLQNMALFKPLDSVRIKGKANSVTAYCFVRLCDRKSEEDIQKFLYSLMAQV